MFGIGKKNDTLQLSIKGMTCQGCVKGVERALSGVDGVKKVKVNLDKNEAIIEGKELDLNSLVAAVEEKGFSAIARN